FEEFLEISLLELEDTTRLSASTLETMRTEARALLKRDDQRRPDVEGAPEAEGQPEELEAGSHPAEEVAREAAERQQIHADSDQSQEG
ncbi:MAG: hypothetical protein M0Z81_19390, partial [Deltaproteobacteria bacterium]|nr:hypothetical protein [Deltaproteobacteria bacterium]